MVSFSSLTRNITLLLVVIIVLFVLLLQFAGVGSFFTIVESGTVRVSKTFGSISDVEMYPGFHLKLPITSTITFDTRTLEYTMSVNANNSTTGEADTLSALTFEGLSIELDLSVLYRLIPDKASDVYTNIGTDYQEKVIRPLIRGVIREEISKFKAKDVYSEKREAVLADISGKLSEEMEKRGFVLENILIRHIQLPPDLEQSISAKLTAEQESQRYEFLLEQAEKEAERKRIEAEGQAAAQKIISESLTDRYLYYEYIKDLKDRAGTIYVPVNPQTGMPMFKNIE